jgi:hypothetical protein
MDTILKEGTHNLTLDTHKTETIPVLGKTPAIPVVQVETQFSWPEDARKSGLMWPRATRIKYLQYVMEAMGLRNINKKELALQFGVSRTMLYYDVEYLYQIGVPASLMERAKVDILSGMRLATRTTEKVLLESTDPNDKLKAAQVHAEVLLKETELLERWEVKRQAIEQVDNNVTIRWAGLEPVAKVIDAKYISNNGQEKDKSNSQIGTPSETTNATPSTDTEKPQAK